jgi:hypothetical protein
MLYGEFCNLWYFSASMRTTRIWRNCGNISVWNWSPEHSCRQRKEEARKKSKILCTLSTFRKVGKMDSRLNESLVSGNTTILFHRFASHVKTVLKASLEHKKFSRKGTFFVPAPLWAPVIASVIHDNRLQNKTNFHGLLFASSPHVFVEFSNPLSWWPKWGRMPDYAGNKCI